MNDLWTFAKLLGGLAFIGLMVLVAEQVLGQIKGLVSIGGAN